MPVVHGVSFTAEPGTVTALVVRRAEGSPHWLADCALYDVNDGVVRISGVDVREASFRGYFPRRDRPTGRNVVERFGAYQYRAVETVGNARRGRGSSPCGMHPRSHYASARGYDTVLGEVGGFLSGGERQRITLARAYLQDAPILILDEATAQADPQSERAIHEALSTLASGRTVIIIAHRLATIRDADQILVIEDGHITQRGRHEDLVNQAGI